MWKRILPIAAALFALAAGPALADGPTITVTAKDAPLAAKYTVEGSLLGWTRAARVSVTPATGDLDGDGVAEVVTANEGIVTVREGRVIVRVFQPYQGFSGGISVAVGDVNGDGRDDIITGASTSGGPHVKVFSGPNGELIRSFLAGGSDKAIIAIAVERGIIAILVGPEIRVYDAATLALKAAFLPFGGARAAGVAIA